MNNNDAIIKIENLSKAFGDQKVLDNINLTIKPGEFVTILGPSGCGKTTLLRILGGFTSADEGKIYMDGNEISQVPAYRRKLNTVFQKYALFPHLDVYDNVAFGLKLSKMPKKDISLKVARALKVVTMIDYEDRDVNSL